MLESDQNHAPAKLPDRQAALKTRIWSFIRAAHLMSHPKQPILGSSQTRSDDSKPLKSVGQQAELEQLQRQGPKKSAGQQAELEQLQQQGPNTLYQIARHVQQQPKLSKQDLEQVVGWLAQYVRQELSISSHQQAHEELLDAENWVAMHHSPRQENQTTVLIKGVQVTQITEPQFNITPNMAADYLQCLTEKPPQWFQDMPQWSQDYLKTRLERVKDKPNPTHIANEVGLPSATRRFLPGLANFTQQKFKIPGDKKDDSPYTMTSLQSAILVPIAVKDGVGQPNVRFQGHSIATGDDARNNHHRLQLAKQSLQQLIQVAAQMRGLPPSKESADEKPPSQSAALLEQQEKEGSLPVFILPILVQTLVSPNWFNPERTMILEKDKAIRDLIGSRKNSQQFYLNAQGQLSTKPGGAVVRVQPQWISTNHALNGLRHFTGWGGNRAGLQALQTAYNAFDRRNKPNLSPEQTFFWEMAQQAMTARRDLASFGGWLRRTATFNGDNSNLFRAALEEIVVHGIGGVPYGGCKSCKDRKSAQRLMVQAMVIFYKENNKRLPSIYDGRKEKEQLADIFADLYVANHYQRDAAENAPGSFGFKGHGNGVLPRHFIRAIEKKGYDMSACHWRAGLNRVKPQSPKPLQRVELSSDEDKVLAKPDGSSRSGSTTASIMRQVGVPPTSSSVSSSTDPAVLLDEKSAPPSIPKQPTAASSVTPEEPDSETPSVTPEEPDLETPSSFSP